MTGLLDYNRPAFDKVAKEFRSKGYTVFSPSEVGDREVIMPRSWYMKKDIEALLNSNSIVLLPDWDKSEGAKLEVEIAKQLEMSIILYA